MSITYGGDNITFPDGSTQNTSPQTGFVNRLINGDMRIDQRNAGAALTPAPVNQVTVDRLLYSASQTGKFNFQQNASGAGPDGFPYYAGFTSASAYSSISSDFFAASQRIEGFNISDLGWGSATAKTVTLSFWVKTSLTGLHSGSLVNGSFNRSYPYSFTVSSANTWEYKTITIPGDTSGTWNITNGFGAGVVFNLGCGSDRLGTAGAWVGSEKLGVTGAVSVVGTSGATFYITGVSLVKGSTALPWEFRSYGQELALAQRYYWRSGNGGIFNTLGSSVVASSTAVNGFALKTPVTMRAVPTVSISNLRVYDGATPASISSISAAWSSTDVLALDFTTGSGLVTGRNAVVQHNNSATAYVDASSEL